MGFVPTTDNNLRRIVEQWLRDQTVWQLRARTAAGSLVNPAAGKALLRDPIARAMMLRPMPEFIWRTALEDHALTTTDGGMLGVRAGDRMVLGLVSATQQGLENGVRDVRPVFGGDRWATPAPRHACPGRPSAMGVMAGVLSALVDTPLALRPSTLPGLLSFEGPVTRVSPPGAARLRYTAAGGAKGVLLAWGDSWFNLHHPLSFKDWDLARSLADLGWNTDGFDDFSTEGLTLGEMAHVPRRTGFYRLVRQKKPLAVLIDGGGNDVHKNNFDLDPSDPEYGRSPLHRVTNPAGSTETRSNRS